MALPQPDPGAAYLQPYREALEQFGPSFKATLWMNQKAQSIRFDVARGLIDPSGLRLLDAGCARGELIQHLAELGKIPAAYIGLDAFPDFIHAARELQPEQIENVTFEVADFVTDKDLFARHEPDVVMFSGSLNTLRQKQALEVVGRAFQQATVGVVFNFLSDRHHPRFTTLDTGPANRFSAAQVVDWALQQTPRVQFRQDYLDGHDASVALLKLQE